jgi:hypothetical protein
VAALYAEADGHGDIGWIWGANLLAFAHSDMRSGGVQGLEIDVGKLGADVPVPVAGMNVFAIGPVPSDVAIGILNGTAAGPGGFREGIAFRSNPGGTAVSEALIRVQPGFGRVGTGIDLENAEFVGAAIATPGFRVGARGDLTSAIWRRGDASFVRRRRPSVRERGIPCGLTAPTSPIRRSTLPGRSRGAVTRGALAALANASGRDCVKHRRQAVVDGGTALAGFRNQSRESGVVAPISGTEEGGGNGETFLRQRPRALRMLAVAANLAQAEALPAPGAARPTGPPARVVVVDGSADQPERLGHGRFGANRVSAPGLASYRNRRRSVGRRDARLAIADSDAVQRLIPVDGKTRHARRPHGRARRDRGSTKEAG